MRLPYRLKQLQNKKKILFAFVLCLIFQFSFSQETTEQPLSRILSDLEEKFEIRFSYNESVISNLKVKSFPTTFTLSQSLDNLSNTLLLQFTPIDNRYIAIGIKSVPISICGIIINTETGEPLAEASLVTSSSQTSSNKGGNFEFSSIASDEIVRVYYLGIEVKKFRAFELYTSPGNCKQVFINEDLNLLPTVILKSYITKGISKNSDGSVTITKKNFEILPSLIEPDILQIAQVLPGIESYDETASNINIRGGKNDELLLLWDDIRVYQSGHFFGLISAFNPNLTQDVTIYKNGTSPRFGEGVSGVLSMQSDNEIPEEITGGIGINLSSINGYARIPASEKLSFNVSGRTSINNGIGNPVYKQFFRKTFQNTVITNLQNNTTEGLRSTDEKFNFYDISIKGLWDVSAQDKVRYSFLTVNNQLQFAERFVSSNNSSATISDLNQRTLMNGLSWNRDWTHRFSSKLFWYGSSYFLDESNTEIDTEESISQRNEVKDTGVKMDLIYAVNDMIQLKAGYQYSETNVTDTQSATVSTAIISNNQNVTSHAVFLDSKWDLFQKKTQLTLGLRATNYPNLNASYYEPRMNIYQNLSDNLDLFASGELKNQTIFQFIDVESNLLGVENKKWTASNNDDSPIIESKQFSIGANFSLNNWTLTSEGFYKQVDGISTRNQGFRNQLQNIDEIGSYEAKGVEFSLSKQTEKLSAWLSYTFMKNDYTFDGLAPSVFRNNLDVRHSLNLAATYSFKKFKFSLGNTYHSGIPYTTPIGNEEINTQNGVSSIDYNSPNNDSLDDYFRTDFSAVYEFKLDENFSGKINLAMLNIFNQKNALATYYKLETDNQGDTSINRIDKFSLGFTPNISFLLLF